MAEGQAVASEVTRGGDNASAAIAMENELLDNLPACRRFLVPSNIISDLLIMFQESERPLIREKLLLMEESDRVKAVNRLMGEVLVHGEGGFNYLLNALRGDVGELPEWWNRALEPTSESSHFEAIKEEQYTVLMDAFEGQLIRKISEGELKAILLKLETRKVIKRIDVDRIRRTLDRDGQEKASQFMMTCLRRSGNNWAWELFLVLVQVKPDLVRKVDPFDENYEENEEKMDDNGEKEKRSCSFQKPRASSTENELGGRVGEDHETFPSWTGAEGAFDRSPQTAGPRTDETFDDCDDFSDSEEKYAHEESEKPQQWGETELKKPQL